MALTLLCLLLLQKNVSSGDGRQLEPKGVQQAQVFQVYTAGASSMQATTDTWNCHCCLCAHRHPVCSHRARVAACVTTGSNADVFYDRISSLCCDTLWCVCLPCTFLVMQVVELVHRYDAGCVPVDDKVGFIQNSRTDKTCTVTMNVPKYMKSPIHVYYLIDGFYQNH